MKNMKKKVFFLFFIFIVFAVFSYGVEVNLKLSGSLYYLNLDHINRSLRGWEEWIKRAGPFYNEWTYKEGEVNKFHSGIALEGSLLFFINPRLTVGIGSGYIYGELSEEKTALTVDKPKATSVYVRPAKINVFPLNFSAYYFFPLRSNVKLYAQGGFGLAWAKFIEREGIEKSEKKYTYYWDRTATALGQAYFTGIGLIYEADPNVCFFVEGEARLSKISGFEGETPEGEEGTLFFFEEYNADLDFWQTKNMILTDEPSGENFRSVQETVADLSGFSVKIGLLIKF